MKSRLIEPAAASRVATFQKHRFKAARLAVPLGPIRALAESQKSEGAGREA
jgi:hypothetical protein